MMPPPRSTGYSFLKASRGLRMWQAVPHPEPSPQTAGAADIVTAVNLDSAHAFLPNVRQSGSVVLSAVRDADGNLFITKDFVDSKIQELAKREYSFMVKAAEIERLLHGEGGKVMRVHFAR